MLHAVRRAVQDGALHAPVPERISVERPRPGGCGDYATNVALRLAGPAGQPPRAVAETLRTRIADDPRIAAIDITGPGFLNITLEQGAQRALVRRVLAQGVGYGHLDTPAGDQPARGKAGSGADVAPDPGARGGTSPVSGPRSHRPQGSRALLWERTVERLRRSQGLPPEHTPLPVVPVSDTFAGAVRDGDAVRWALLSAAAHDRPRPFEEFLRQREGNPLFHVRYAHSRARALTRDAARLGFVGDAQEQVDTALVQLIEDYPGVLESAARLRAPDRLVRHLEAVADTLLDFQHGVLPLGDEKPTAAHRSRLALAEAAGTVLAGGLSLLGISAPVHL